MEKKKLNKNFNNGFINPYNKVINRNSNKNKERLLGSKIFYIFIKELLLSEISNKEIFSYNIKSNNSVVKYLDTSFKKTILNNTLEKVFDSSSQIFNCFIGTSKKIDLSILNEMINLHKVKSKDNNKVYLFLTLLGMVIINTSKNSNDVGKLILSEFKDNKEIKNISPILERYSFINKKNLKDNVIPFLTIIGVYSIPSEKMNLVYEKWNFAKKQIKKYN